MGDERDVDGIFVTARDEFLGAVQRIDQEKAVLIGPRGQIGAFLGQCRISGTSFANPLR
jgi:hypothetical protein